MARRIRPKVREKPKPEKVGEAHTTRIKIRRGRASSDPFEQALLKAKELAEKDGKKRAKDAGFKGFKSGVKKGKADAKAKLDSLNRAMDALELREQLSKDRLGHVERCISLWVNEADRDDRLLQLNAKGLRLGNVGPAQNERYKLLWDTDRASMSHTVAVETTETEAEIVSSSRHRLHPGRKCSVQDMWDVWAAAGNNKIDVDPMQGMRGAWYWNERRFGSKSSAMTAWRRHMREKRAHATLDEHAAVADNRILRDRDGVDRVSVETLIEEDVDDVAEFVAHDFTPEELHNGRMLRNRLNGFFRNHEEQSTRWWTQHYTLNIDRIQAAQQMEGSYLTPFVRVLTHFEVPLEHWDDDNWTSFRMQYNHYLEVKQNRGDTAAGVPRRRRRRGRSAVRRQAADGGYNRSDF